MPKHSDAALGSVVLAKTSPSSRVAMRMVTSYNSGGVTSSHHPSASLTLLLHAARPAAVHVQRVCSQCQCRHVAPLEEAGRADVLQTQQLQRCGICINILQQWERRGGIIDVAVGGWVVCVMTNQSERLPSSLKRQ
jgi:hypothetical protein